MWRVANAGIGRAGSVLDMDLKDWQDQLDINLTGVFLTVQAAAQRMKQLGNGGRIVCISSLAALNTSALMWSYSATKVGVRMMVRAGRKTWASTASPSTPLVQASSILPRPWAGR
jgi:NAD(P)-dependent dehydrogenase (short-subunit alcohol dehydrogenase family)